MKKAKDSRYFFQRRKISFTRRLFEQGLNTTSYILFALKDFGQDFSQGFLNELPNTYPGFKLMKAMFGCSSKKRFKKNTVKVSIFRLKKQGLIREGKNKKLCLTDKGKEMVIYIKDRYSVLEKPWDKKIRLIVFDIPEKKSHFRKWFREELVLLKYKLLQKSVYIGKYPISDDLYQDLIKRNLLENVHIFTVEKSDKQKELISLLRE